MNEYCERDISYDQVKDIIRKQIQQIDEEKNKKCYSYRTIYKNASSKIRLHYHKSVNNIKDKLKNIF